MVYGRFTELFSSHHMYTKLFSSLTDSTVWGEEDHTRLVWITMLAMADKHGHVAASVPGLATRSRVSLEKTVKALARLMETDEWSRSKEEDGRRIREEDGGWVVINYTKYAKIRDEEERKEYMRNYMRKRRKQFVNNVSSVNHGKPWLAHTDTDTDIKSEDRVREEDLDLAVHEIAALYPKIKDPTHLSHEVALAIAEAVARDGRDLVWAGVKGMAEAIAKWPKSEMRFIPSAPRYFRESQYKTNPLEWERGNGNGREQVSPAAARAERIKRNIIDGLAADNRRRTESMQPDGENGARPRLSSGIQSEISKRKT